MKQVLAVFLAVVFAVAFITAARAAEPTEGMQRFELITARATIQSVDLQNRMVTLRGPKGNLFSVNVGENVGNLSELKPGDQVMVKYYESVAVQMAKPGERPMMYSREVQRTMPGQPATRMQQVTTTATVESIDKSNSEVTLRGPEGNMVTVKARDPSAIEKLKEGDQLNITYTQAMAVSLEKAAG